MCKSQFLERSLAPMEKVGSEKEMAKSKVFRSLSDTFVIAAAESQEEGPHTPEWGLRT